jgi:predicted deacylase
LYKKNKKLLLFEGGKTNSIDEFVVSEALEGVKRIMHFLDLRHFKVEKKEKPPIVLKSSKWLRASTAGMLLVYVKNGDAIKSGDILGVISDPFGKIERKIRATIDGYVFCVNEAPVVNKGDAIFNIGSEGVTPGHGLHHSSIKED